MTRCQNCGLPTPAALCAFCDAHCRPMLAAVRAELMADARPKNPARNYPNPNRRKGRGKQLPRVMVVAGKPIACPSCGGVNTRQHGNAATRQCLGCFTRFVIEQEYEISGPVRRSPKKLTIQSEPPAVHIDGIPIRLQLKQHQLLDLLVRNAGRLVPYETVYRELWGNRAVEGQYNIHFQKRQLLDRTTPHLKVELVKTVPKRGLVLDARVCDIEIVGMEAAA